MAEDPGSIDGAAPKSNSSRPERTPNFSDYLRIFTYATKCDFCMYFAASLASVGAGVMMPLMNVVFGQLVGKFTDYFKDPEAMPRGDLERIINQQALYIMALFLGRWGLSAINKFCFRMIGIRLSSAVRLRYLQSLLAHSIHTLDTLPPGALAIAITSTANTLQLGVSELLGTFLMFNGTVWAALIIAFVWSWDLTLVTSSLMLYLLAVLGATMPLNIKGQNAILKADGEATAIASEALGGIRLVMVCGAQGSVIARYNNWVQEALKRGQKIAPVLGIQFGLVFFGVIGAFGLSFWYGMQRYTAGAIDNAGAVIVVLMSVLMILNSLERIVTPLMAVSKAMVAACELFTVIDAVPPASGSLKPQSSSQDLVFNEVTFEYPSRPGVKALDGLSFRIRSGQNTALVGPSGSGKSTIVGLLERWYSLRDQHALPRVVEARPKKKTDDEKSEQPDKEPKAPVKPTLSGSITVGGVNVEDLDPFWWRAQVGLVQQEPFLFNDTIYGNVANGLIGTEWQDEPEARKRELVQEACREAYAHEFISRLPDKYDTRVGDGGAKLSGGQKQRLAIARSIIKRPCIIIFDEATSAIDAKSERLVQAALDRVAQNHTTITIAHRLSTIKKADNIIVLQKGRAVEQGTHQSLTADPSGVYSSLVRAQSLHLLTQDTPETEIAKADSDSDSKKAAINSYQDGEAVRTSGDQEKVTRQPRNLFCSFPELLRKQQVHWLNYLGILLSALGVGTQGPVQAWLFAKVLGVFLMNEDELESQGDFWGLIWLALAGAIGIAYFFDGWLSIRVQYFVSAAFKRQYLADMLHQKLAFFDEDANSHGTLSSRIATDAKLLEELFGLNMAMFLSGVFTVVGCIIIALIFSWKLGLVAMFITMPIMLTSALYRYRHEVKFDQMNLAVFAESSQFATEAIGAMRTVSSLTMEAAIIDRYQRLLDGHVRAAQRKAQWTSAFLGFAESATLGCRALIFWYGGSLLSRGECLFEAFFVCFMAIIQGAETAALILSLTPSAAQATAAANRILDVHESTEKDRGGTPDSWAIPGSDGGVGIELRDVHFKYPTRDILVFEDLNLTVERGQYAAFVGPSGCGKTTIISLLERFYDLGPGQGTILCNGININNFNLYDYRRNLSLVSQEPLLFHGTVRDNILFGVEDLSSVSDEKIHEVCRNAFIHDFIVSLPEGYDTDVGQKGVSMSGGQKQRIAIARALVRDPKILLLDEATSALDSESEKVVQEAFERARAGRTMITVAHRLSTIQEADVIFVFDEGRVVEKGKHNELINKKGYYWEMCQSQALDQ